MKWPVCILVMLVLSLRCFNYSVITITTIIRLELMEELSVIL